MYQSAKERMMRTAIESRFDATDGTRLFYRYWPSADDTFHALVLLHRGHEHSERLQHLVDELDLPGYAMFAWDARGHGLSRTDQPGDPTLSTFVEDLEKFVRHISIAHGFKVENLGVIAQSMGGVLAATWVHDFAPKIRFLILATPAFKIKLYVPLARPALRVAAVFAPKMRINSYVKPSALTHDPDRIESYKSDPLIQRPIAVKVLLAMYGTSDRVIEDAGTIHTPTLMLISGKDLVVHEKPQHRFFERLGSAIKERHVFPGFYHDTLGEKERHRPIAKAREFALRLFAEPPMRTDLLDADKRGYTRNEFEKLRRPLSRLSPKGAMFSVTRAAMATGGRLSEGIRLGLKTGFDSGSTLDYVYRSRPSGITPIGRMIDWSYVNSIGWRGIRIRKQHVESLIARAIELLADKGLPIRLIDVAAGHGRYVLEAIEKMKVQPGSVLLRDYSDLNVEAGRLMIQQKKMSRFVRFENGDAFDRISIGEVRPRPTIGVVSGLYELFPDNGVVRESLAGLADAVEPGGYLVYTGQPWHPQLEMIARVLPSHRDHQPWVMRRRSQGELDQLVEAAGFRKLEQAIDEWGIFTVSLAERVDLGPKH